MHIKIFLDFATVNVIQLQLFVYIKVTLKYHKVFFLFRVKQHSKRQKATMTCLLSFILQDMTYTQNEALRMI